MSALVSWVCRVEHAVQDREEYLDWVTTHEGTWAYCQRGGAEGHSWEPVEPTPVEMLRTRRGRQVQARAADSQHR